MISEDGTVKCKDADLDMLVDANAAMHVAKVDHCVVCLVDVNDPSKRQKIALAYDEDFWNTKVLPKLMQFEDILLTHVILKKYNPHSS